MAFFKKHILAFNRGVISSLGLARIDIERMAMSAETQTNFMPRVLGSMMLRPGLQFIERMNNDVTTAGRLLPFIFGVDETVLLAFDPTIIIPYVNDVKLTSLLNTSTGNTNSNFTTDLSGWTDASEAGGNVAWQVGGHARIWGDGTDFGILRQTITVNEQGQDHRLGIQIFDGPMRFKVGSTAGDDDYVSETRLGRGVHEISVWPTTSSYVIEFANEREFSARVTRCTAPTAANTVTLGHGFSVQELIDIRWAQSGDVIFMTSSTGQIKKLERRGKGNSLGRSWSMVDHLPEDGPFRVQNVSGNELTASALNGDITLTSRLPVFKQEHADNRALFRIASQGQTVTSSISAQNVFTDAIKITGNEAARVFGLIIENRTDSTITLQFAFTADGPWTDTSPQYTANTSISYDDGQDDQIIYYRLGIKTGDYGTDTVTCTLNYTGGSIQGVCRVYGFTTSISVTAHVLKDFGAITASRDWWEGAWSDARLWPTAVAIHEGRLWYAGNDNIWGSTSDAYETFDDNILGDSAPIDRSVGEGPIKTINWLVSMGRLMMGTTENTANVRVVKMDGNNPLGARSNTFDEPLTPSNFNIKSISSRGAFIDRTEQRLYELIYDIDQQDYKPIDLSIYAPDFNQIGVIQIAVQMKPDIRIHCIRSDGTVGVLVYDRLENVICWVQIDSTGATGEITDVAVLPGTVEDQVYYLVKRTINAGQQRHICKWALESEAIGGQLNKIADSFVVYDSTATTTPFTTQLLHLRGETVTIWADGIDVGTDTVTAAGALTSSLAVAASKVVAGLSYIAQFKSAKLGELTGAGLMDRKKVSRLGFIAQNMHYQGLQYGPTFAQLYDLPQVEEGQTTAVNTVHATYHEDNFPFGGEWDPDARICLQAASPRPVTLLAAIAEIETVERQRTRSS